MRATDVLRFALVALEKYRLRTGLMLISR